MITYDVVKYILIGIAILGSLGFGFGITKYFRDYKIFQMLYAKIRGRAAEADRIRRQQMKEDFKRNEGILAGKNTEKPSLMSRIYREIQMTGITSAIPGFSETSFIVLFLLIGLVLFAGVAYKLSPIVGVVAIFGYFIITRYIFSMIKYRRQIKAEEQLLDFVNTIATASRQYSNIADILGATYEDFQQPLSEAMEACYVESKTSRSTELAIKHMKDKFDSVQIAYVLDNLLLCSNATGDYASVAQDLSKTVSIYLTSHEKKQAQLRNAKITLAVIFILGGVAMFAVGEFVGGVGSLFNNTVGQIISILIAVLVFYGMNIKAE